MLAYKYQNQTLVCYLSFRRCLNWNECTQHTHTSPRNTDTSLIAPPLSNGKKHTQTHSVHHTSRSQKRFPPNGNGVARRSRKCAARVRARHARRGLYSIISKHTTPHLAKVPYGHQPLSVQRPPHKPHGVTLPPLAPTHQNAIISNRCG